VGWLTTNSEAMQVRISVKMADLKDGGCRGGITSAGGETESALGMEIGTSLIHSNLVFTQVPYLFSFLL
jgi:hypothetical protein